MRPFWLERRPISESGASLIKLVSRVRLPRVHPTVRSRVLIVSQPAVYGVAICIRELVQSAIGAGYEIAVARPLGI